jgi:hypothetical protein
MRLSINPWYATNVTEMQYVSTEIFAPEGQPEEDRYLFGSLDQETLGMTLRLDYTLTPNLTLQYYGSPFLSNGSYTAHKRITNPRAPSYRERFDTFDEDQIHYDAETDTYEIDENRDGTVDYAFGDPNFNFRDFNSNLVLRWEFQPGSLVYLVWQQARSQYLPQASANLSDDFGSLFDVTPHNAFMIKVNKWFSL